MTFNYSTGPVELSARVRTSLAIAPTSSHEPEAQRQIAETLGFAAQVLNLPPDFVTILLPGSIRAALDAVIGALCGAGIPADAAVTGYWGRFLAEAAIRHGSAVTTFDPRVEGPAATGTVVMAVHTETEFGDVLPISGHLKAARAAGAVTIVDAACSMPADELDPDDADILVLGSHKVLGGPPGLGVIAVRRAVLERLIGPQARWDLRAYARDALVKWRYLGGEATSPAGRAPLVTYPVQVVCALRAALLERMERGIDGAAHAAAAAALRDGLRSVGIQPYLSDTPSSAVIRGDLPTGISGDALRAELARRGFFVIGGIGGSAGSFIRIGAMSPPQLDAANIRRLVEALEQSLPAASKAREVENRTPPETGTEIAGRIEAR